MSVRKISENKWFVRVQMRVDGKLEGEKKTIQGTRQDAKDLEIKFLQALRQKKKVSSLTITKFEDAIDYYMKYTSADLSRLGSYFKKLKYDLGSVPIDSSLTTKFVEYWALLKKERSKRYGKLLRPSTRNHFLKAGKTAINFCIEKGVVAGENPLRSFEKDYDPGRNRVLDEDEQSELLRTLREYNSHLYWPVYFSLKNPIRKGDLIGLVRENLDMFQPWVHHIASKTEEIMNQRETVLPFIDEPLKQYFLSLPKDCPYLFPYMRTEKGEWRPLGDFKNHWQHMLREAEITDFHFHDLKHCAITWMLDNDYTERDLKNLAIQYDPKMIERYYKKDAKKVLKKWQKQVNIEKIVQSEALKTGT